MNRDRDNILLSIFCITYNHELYIEDAICIFLEQETDFDYEIVIHDDCSTDRTREIIKTYRAQYPDKIRVIYPEENQYSLGRSKYYIRNKDLMRGKYIAICEGDDYWIDPHKLQKQVDYMEENPSTVMCCHATRTEMTLNGQKQYVESRIYEQSQIISTEAAIAFGGGVCKISSQVIRKCVFDERLPEFIWKFKAGDYPLQIWYTWMGEIYYMDEVMGAYRCMHENSWTFNMVQNPEKRIHFKMESIEMLSEMNEYSSHKYQDFLYYAICGQTLEAIVTLNGKGAAKDWLDLYKYYSQRIENPEVKAVALNKGVETLSRLS